MTSTHKRAVGIFPDRPRTASALQALNDSGFDMKHVSVIAKEPRQQNPIAGVDVKGEVGNQANTGGTVGVAAGGVLGGVGGLLVGLGTLTIPGIGPAVLAGEVTALLTTLIGGASGAVAGGLVGALIGLGIPEHKAKRYRDRVSAGEYLVMLKATDPEIARAERSLKAAGIEDWGVYHATDSSSESSTRDADHAETGAVHNGTSQKEGSQREFQPEPASSQHQLDEGRHNDHPTGLPHASNPVVGSSEDKDYSGDGNQESSHSPHAHSGSGEQRAMGIFHDQHRLEEALGQLKQTGFPMHILSILVRESKSDSGEGQQSSLGHPLAGATSLMSGLNHVDLPEIGSTLVMGSDADNISKLSQKDGSHDAVGVLKNLGIAEEAARLYSRHLADGDYLVTVEGQNQDVLQAASTLGGYGMRDWGIYDVQRSL